MPAPAVYAITVAGVVATVAAGFAFHHYVYEPHLAPKIEAWAQDFLARREQARRRRAGPIPVTVASDRAHAESPSQRLGNSVELDNLMTSEVDEWRAEVDRSRTESTLRQRRTLNQSSMRFTPMRDTHVLFDPSVPPTPTSTITPPPELAQPMLPSTSFRLPTPLTSPTRSAHTLSPSVTISDVRSPSVGFASPLPSPPPQLPRSETSLSDLDLLSVHSMDDVLSTSSWASAHPSDR